MKQLNSKKFGIATGLTGTIFYLFCTALMTIIGQDILVKMANLLFHGIDFSNIIRMNIPLFESFLGIVISFLFWGILGYLTSLIYNKLK